MLNEANTQPEGDSDMQGTQAADTLPVAAATVYQALAGLPEWERSALLDALKHNPDTFDREQHAQGRLLEITHQVAREADSEALLTRIVSTASEVLDADRSTLFLLDEEAGELYSRVAEGMPRQQIRIPLHSGLAGHVFLSGQSTNVACADTDPRFNASIDTLAGYATQTVLAAPVLGRHGTPLGVLQALNKRSGRFTLVDQIRLETLATQTALVLEYMALMQQSARARRFADNILESVTCAVVTLDQRMRVTSINTAAERLFATPVAQTNTLTLRQLFRKCPEALEVVIGSVITRGARESMKQFPLLTADGRELRVNVQVAPFAAADGAQLGVVLEFQDVSREFQLEQTLRRYLPIPARHSALTEQQTLGGETRHATVLFSDIAGFTQISEQLGASATVDWLNEYFTLMGEVVALHGGHIDKFIGDAVMAVFGMHESAPDDADRALICALDMQQRLVALNTRLRATGRPTMHIRIGVNTDEVLIGNIGSVDRMSYTVVGDGANVASRLESANKVYGSRILLSQGTVASLASAERFCLRPLDTVRVRGRTTPVDIFELMGLFSSNAAPLTERYAEGLGRLRAERALDAYMIFSALAELYPEDVPTQMMLRRTCNALTEGTCIPFLINDLRQQ